MPHCRIQLRACVPLLLVLLPAVAAAGPRTLAPEADDTAVAGDVRLAPGTHSIRDANGNGVLRITADGTTLDLTGAALIGAADDVPADAFAGVGVLVEGAKGVTIRGGVIRGFKIAIKAVNAPGLVIEGVDASENFRQRLGSTPEREDAGDWLWPHTNDGGEWERRYGAGFSLTACDRARVLRCRVRDGQNGLLLTRCTRVHVEGCDFSFNSGWGIALYRSNRCKVLRNRCDWCVRGYSHGVYHRGQDSAGILVFEQSSDNVFVGNSATHSGDGFFLYAGHETTQRTGKGGCDRNLVFDNDFSHAVANGIEATFSTDNVFVRNDCSDSDHGVWAGYSSQTLIAGNRIHDCLTAGISIEHGQGNRIVHNDIVGARVGVHLWWDHDKAFVDGVFGKHRDTSSSGNELLGNDILGADVAVKLVQDTGTTLRWNQLYGRKACLHLGAGTKPGAVVRNLFCGSRLRSREPSLTVLDETGTGWALSSDNARRGRLRGTGAVDPALLPESLTLMRPRARLPATPAGVDGPPARLSEEMPRGRKEMRIGPWGPLDPRRPHVFPAEILVGGREAALHLSGRGTWALLRTVGRVELTPDRGELPATARVRVLPLPGDAGVSQLVPFAVELRLGDQRRRVTGHLLEVLWDVRWFQWTTDPREDDAAWKSGKPVRVANVEALAFPWKTKGPEGLKPDRFGTVAQASLRLDKGRYRIRTVSDDGIRVWVNDKRVIDNWTHHAPTEDVAEVALEAGTHVLRVEHFEIDGWAHLELRIEPVTR
ncbi:MAG: right-handed parallel beta-helix repeat-containing protein [Planctomycetota bacterium]|nr:right-handed parallel beta-helix repeat-containing protein [Planctomycetota bacterium]